MVNILIYIGMLTFSKISATHNEKTPLSCAKVAIITTLVEMLSTFAPIYTAADSLLRELDFSPLLSLALLGASG